MSTLTATYTSPTSTPTPLTISASLPALSSSPTTDDRVAYLAALQTSIKTLQAHVNTFLTQKMGEDTAAGVAGAGKVDDAKDEEYYGEEVVEGD